MPRGVHHGLMGSSVEGRDAVRVLEGQAASERAARALAAYFAELDERFAEGYDPELTHRVDAQEVTPPHGDFILVTEVGTGEVVGCGGVRVIADGVVEVRRMWLAPTARGHGLGRFLLKSLENRARSLGARRVLLGVHEALEEAIALFRSAGYREVPDELPDRYVTQVLGKDLG